MRWGIIDIRERDAQAEKELRAWPPRSGSVSKPYRKTPRDYAELVEYEREQFERYHQFSLIVEDTDSEIRLLKFWRTHEAW